MAITGVAEYLKMRQRIERPLTRAIRSGNDNLKCFKIRPAAGPRPPATISCPLWWFKPPRRCGRPVLAQSHPYSRDFYLWRDFYIIPRDFSRDNKTLQRIFLPFRKVSTLHRTCFSSENFLRTENSCRDQGRTLLKIPDHAACFYGR